MLQWDQSNCLISCHFKLLFKWPKRSHWLLHDSANRKFIHRRHGCWHTQGTRRNFAPSEEQNQEPFIASLRTSFFQVQQFLPSRLYDEIVRPTEWSRGRENNLLGWERFRTLVYQFRLVSGNIPQVYEENNRWKTAKQGSFLKRCPLCYPSDKLKHRTHETTSTAKPPYWGWNHPVSRWARARPLTWRSPRKHARPTVWPLWCTQQLSTNERQAVNCTGGRIQVKFFRWAVGRQCMMWTRRWIAW